MNEKVKLPREVCQALDEAKFIHPTSNYTIVARTFDEEWRTPETKILNSIDTDTIMQALVLGYEVENTAEEKVKNLYLKSALSSNICEKRYCDGIRDTLKAYGIKYDWMADE